MLDCSIRGVNDGECWRGGENWARLMEIVLHGCRRTCINDSYGH